MSYDPALILSLIAIIISLFSLLFSYERTKEAKIMTRLKKSETAEKLIDIVEKTIDKIKNGDDGEEIETITLDTVREIQKSEVLIGKNLFNTIKKINQPMWDAVREKQNYLNHGIGKVTTPDATYPPQQKLSNFENCVRMTVFQIRRKLKT